MARWRIFVLSLVGAPVWGAPRDFVFCLPGGPGSTEEARPFLAPFLRHVERALGWPAGESKGEYFPDAAAALDFIRARRPGFGVIGLGTYADHPELRARPIAGAVMTGGSPTTTYHLVAREGAAGLDALRGTRLVTNHYEEIGFLSRAAFGRKVDLARHFEVVPTRRPLQGIRAVARGEAGATLVDGVQLEHMARLELEHPLAPVVSSPPLPPLPVVAFGGVARDEDATPLGRFLVAMCADGKGREICRSLRAERFVEIDAAAYERLRSPWR